MSIFLLRAVVAKTSRAVNNGAERHSLLSLTETTDFTIYPNKREFVLIQVISYCIQAFIKSIFPIICKNYCYHPIYAFIPLLILHIQYIVPRRKIMTNYIRVSLFYSLFM